MRMLSGAERQRLRDWLSDDQYTSYFVLSKNAEGWLMVIDNKDFVIESEDVRGIFRQILAALGDA